MISDKRGGGVSGFLIFSDMGGREVSQFLIFLLTRGGGGSGHPPILADIMCEQPLRLLGNTGVLSPCLLLRVFL